MSYRPFVILTRVRHVDASCDLAELAAGVNPARYIGKQVYYSLISIYLPFTNPDNGGSTFGSIDSVQNRRGNILANM